MKPKPSIGPTDNLDFLVRRFLLALKKRSHGHCREISARELNKEIRRFEMASGLRPGLLLDALLRRNILEPIGSDTYAIDYELIR